MKTLRYITWGILPVLLGTVISCGNNKNFKVKTSNLEIAFNANGSIESASLQNGQVQRKIAGHSTLSGCQVIKVQASRLPDGGVTFVKTLVDTLKNNELLLTETFTPTANSIRWEVLIEDDAASWTTPIETLFKYPTADNVTHWLPWADPRGDISNGGTDNALIANAILNSGDLDDFTSWADPLVTLPLADNKWHYGAPRYEYQNPGILYCPFQGDVISIPMLSFFEEDKDLGLSLVLSPEDLLLDISLETSKDGDIRFLRYNHRLGEGREIKFAMDIVAHPSDWRSSLEWVVNRYAAFFHPVNSLALEMGGTGAYSNSDVAFDVEKMKKMAFRVNWRAAFDFPYLGMYIPPVEKDEEWMGFIRQSNLGKITRKPSSIPLMNAYCKKMDDNGFFVLSYFNVTEFGTQIEYPRPESTRKAGEPLWKNSNDFLYEKLEDAMLFVPEAQKPVLDKGIYSARPGLPFWTWEKAVAMDPGVKSFQDFLAEQARRQVAFLPNAYGICIDRMDWTRMYNHRTDDDVSWMGDQPVGSGFVSWNKIMDRLHPIFHEKNKVIFVNNHVKRIEQLKYVDGIFDEFTYAGSSLNAIALLGNQKPVLGWISGDQQLLPDSDEVMQKYLYLGVFPMAPFPGNDHSIRPSALADKVYLDYGPLFNQLRGREWVLESHVIAVTGGEARVNLFKTFDSYAVPVTYATGTAPVEVTLRKKELIKDELVVKAFYPGEDTPVLIASEVVNGELKIKVPTKRNCAVVKIYLP